jgi:DNA-binding IclR family transcriptional regulator
MVREELVRLKKLPRNDLAPLDVPYTMQDVQTLLTEVRQRGVSRVVHSLLPGVAGFCAPVFDAQSRLALGIVVLGSVTTLDTDWAGIPAQSVLRTTRQLSQDLGYVPPQP